MSDPKTRIWEVMKIQPGQIIPGTLKNNSEKLPPKETRAYHKIVLNFILIKSIKIPRQPRKCQHNLCFPHTKNYKHESQN